MKILLIIIPILMTLIGVFYLYAGIKEKHKGLLAGGFIYFGGALLVFMLKNLWPLPLAYLIALFLNKNPEHD